MRQRVERFGNGAADFAFFDGDTHDETAALIFLAFDLDNAA